MNHYIISLKNSEARRHHIQSVMDGMGLSFEFFDAAVGHDTSMLDNLQKNIDVASFKSNGEMGCAISHLALYKKIITQKEYAAVILEDDIVLSPHFLSILEELKSIVTSNTLLMLGCGSSIGLSYTTSGAMSFFAKKQKGTFGTLYAPREPLMGTFGYIIGNETAQKLWDYASPISMPSDILLNQAPALGISYWALENPIVWPHFEAFESLIRSSHYTLENHNTWRDRLYLFKKTAQFLIKDLFKRYFCGKKYRKHGYIAFLKQPNRIV